MKKSRFLLIPLLMASLLAGCGSDRAPARIAATTLPVYEFTARLCEGTPITVTRLVTEEVSCLHDYSLNVNQVKAAEAAEHFVISGAGLEEFLDDILSGASIIDASEGIRLIEPDAHHHDHDHEEEPEESHPGHDHEEAEESHSGHEHEEATESHDHHEEEPEDAHGHEGHHHEQDPHIWLSPVNAMTMAENICRGLSEAYPACKTHFHANLELLLADLAALQDFGEHSLQDLSCRELITFHDGFAYLAQAFDLEILDAIEEESGSEASAKELIQMIEEVEHHGLPAVFTEKSGSVSAAGIISRETGAKTFALDMAMSGDSYFDAIYHNINTLKEALQ